MSAPLHGVLPVLHIPYREDEEIAYDILGAEIDYVYAQGAQGIVFALASEILRLTDEERRRVAGFLVEANQDRGSVTISVGADSAFAAVQFARHAESVGATALMAIPPLSRALSEAELRGSSGAIQASLWQEYGDRVLFKPEANPVGPVISALRAATQDRAQIFEGSGGMMLAENYRRGIAGTMPGCDLLDAVVALWCALEEGNEARVYALSPLIASLLLLASGLD